MSSIQPRRGFPVRRLSEELASLISLPLLLWGLLWLSLNTGPWDLEGAAAGGWQDVFNAVRASFPVVVPAVALVAMLARERQHRPTLAEGGFWLYALLMLAASLRVPASWFEYAYWALAFLGALAAVQAGLSWQSPLRFARTLNLISWAAAAAILAVLVVVAREALVAHGPALSAYGIQNRLTTVVGTPMSRASGMSRLAAVPALVALVYLFRGRWRQRIVAALVFLGCGVVIWLMQSRGSLFAFGGAFLFVLLLGDRKARWAGLLAASALVAFWIGGALAHGTLRELWLHATRGTGIEGLQRMSGRPQIWRQAWEHIRSAPVLGYGPRGDRRMMGGDAQNALVYALLNAGVLGAVCFVAAMAWAWVCLLRLLRIRTTLSSIDQTMVTITGGLLVFFTLRSVPEDTAAFFSVDLLVQYPAMVYLAVLARRVRATRFEGTAPQIATSALVQPGG